MAKISRPTFKPEFRLEVAQLVLDQDYTIKEAAETMNVGKSTVDNWVRQLKRERSGGSSQGAPITPDQRKIQELENKIKKIEMEKEILKKATALLMSDSMKNSR